jgi:hypothetical protein
LRCVSVELSSRAMHSSNPHTHRNHDLPSPRLALESIAPRLLRLESRQEGTPTHRHSHAPKKLVCACQTDTHCAQHPSSHTLLPGSSKQPRQVHNLLITCLTSMPFSITPYRITSQAPLAVRSALVAKTTTGSRLFVYLQNQPPFFIVFFLALFRVLLKFGTHSYTHILSTSSPRR